MNFEGENPITAHVAQIFSKYDQKMALCVHNLSNWLIPYIGNTHSYYVRQMKVLKMFLNTNG